MKLPILDLNARKISEIETDIFSYAFRQDIIQKAVRVEQLNSKHPYGNYRLAGKEVSATLRHARRKYKTTYGYGISRIPRKILTRRGLRFYWVGAQVNFTRGGRRVHAPIPVKSKLKINKKEKRQALLACLAALANKQIIASRYELNEKQKTDLNKISLPLVIDTLNEIKVKEFESFLSKALGSLYEKAKRKKQIRAGKGKLRGRRYKKNPGILVIKTSKEKFKTKKYDLINIEQLTLTKLAPGSLPGRLVCFTKAALEQLIDKINKIK